MVYNEIIYSSHLLRFWITNLGVPRSKRQGGSKVVPTVHLSEFDQMGTKNTGELGDSKKTLSSTWPSILRQLNPIQKFRVITFSFLV